MIAGVWSSSLKLQMFDIYRLLLDAREIIKAKKLEHFWKK